MLKKTLLTGMVFVLGLGAAMLMPFAGEDSGMSPIPSAWAGFNCDADGDFINKIHRKCPGGTDSDDSDPCYPNPEADACGGGGGGGGGGDLGSAISMDCILHGVWGDSSGETIKGDLLLADPDGAPDSIDGTKYSDAVDKVDCSVDGPSTPWPIRLVMGGKGRPENSVRKVDVNLGSFEPPEGFDDLDGVDDGRLGSSFDLSGDVDDPVYPTLFEAAGGDANGPNMDEMDPIRINVRPYREDETQTEDGIHLLPWSAEPYKMGMRFNFPGTERFNLSIAAQHYPGNESFTGIGCETGFEQQILENAPNGNMRDVSVYLWRDGVDADELPDGYTVSTGVITPRKDGSDYLEGPPDVSYPEPDPDADPPNLDHLTYAAVCSSVGPDTCGNPRAPDNCNFLGYVPVQFTMHTRVK